MLSNSIMFFTTLYIRLCKIWSKEDFDVLGRNKSYLIELCEEFGRKEVHMSTGCK